MMQGRELRSQHLFVSLAAALVSGAALLQAFAYWPGLMTYDSVRQYGQAVDNDFDDWHPPAMEWLWQKLMPIHTGPAPMLLVQLALYWGGLALLIGWATKSARPRLALAFGVCAILPLPLALMGAVLKDCLMAAALLAATGLLVWSPPDRGLLKRFAGIALLIGAAMLRFNAFFACWPLFLALIPPRWRNSRLRLGLSAAVSAALLLAAMPVANHLIGAKRSGVELSLIIFDWGGITKHSGVDVFPPLPVAHPVAVNARCYTPVKWDSYSYWVDPICPINFDALRAALKASGQSPTKLWLEAIAHHPLAYVEHRLVHFNINSRFLVPDEIERPVQVESAPNDWNYRVHPNGVLPVIDQAAIAMAHTPLGWPIWWMAVAVGVLMLASKLPSRDILIPLAASSLLYGLGYLPLSVAAEVRYHLWTMIAALVSAVLALAEVQGAGISRRRLAYAATPAVVIGLLCTVARIV